MCAITNFFFAPIYVQVCFLSVSIWTSISRAMILWIRKHYRVRCSHARRNSDANLQTENTKRYELDWIQVQFRMNSIKLYALHEFTRCIDGKLLLRTKAHIFNIVCCEFGLHSRLKRLKRFFGTCFSFQVLFKHRNMWLYVYVFGVHTPRSKWFLSNKEVCTPFYINLV